MFVSIVGLESYARAREKIELGAISIWGGNNNGEKIMLMRAEVARVIVLHFPQTCLTRLAMVMVMMVTMRH